MKLMKTVRENHYAGFTIYNTPVVATNCPAINIDGSDYPVPTNIHGAYTITRIGMLHVNGTMSLIIYFIADGTIYQSVIPMPNGNYSRL